MSGMRADIDNLLEWAVGMGASDLLLTHDACPMVRVKGSLKPIEHVAPFPDSTLFQLINSMLTESDQRAYERVRQVDFSITWRDQARVRGNAFIQRGHPALALRIVPDRIPTLDELGVPPQVREQDAAIDSGQADVDQGQIDAVAGRGGHRLAGV